MFAKLKRLIANNGEKNQIEALELKKTGDKHIGEERYEQAVEYYRQALSLYPEFSDALIGIGFALTEMGAGDEAVHYLQKALSINPANVDAHFMLGNIAGEKGDFQRAIDCYKKAIHSNPAFSFGYSRLFETFQKLGEAEKAKDVLDRAISAMPESTDFLFERAGLYFAEKDYSNTINLLQKALRLNPDNAAFHMNIAKSFIQSGQFDAAIPHLKQAVRLQPDDASAHENLGNAYLSMENKQDALKCFKEVVRIDPDNPVNHLVAAFSGLTTGTAPSKYVEMLFDNYAESFDSHLVQSLHYNVPGSLVSLIQSCCDLEGQKPGVLDLGCGTGLFGTAISPFAGELVGVDLSSKMLEKAAELGIYQRLERNDVVEMMRGETDASYDLVASTDVFIYIGGLDELVTEVKRILRRDGILAFSAESLDALSVSGDYRLNESGRYAHSMSYLNRLAAERGFKVLAIREEPCRQENGVPIVGYLVLWINSDGV